MVFVDLVVVVVVVVVVDVVVVVVVAAAVVVASCWWFLLFLRGCGEQTESQHGDGDKCSAGKFFLELVKYSELKIWP